MGLQVPQTSVVSFPDVGLNGQIADITNRTIITALADADTDVGLVHVLGASTQTSKVPAASTDITNQLVKGVTCYNPMIEPGAGRGAGNPRFQAGDALNLMSKGRIWVLSYGTTVDMGPVYIVYSGANAGRIAGSNPGGGNPAAADTRFRVVQGGLDGALILVECNLP